MSRPEFHIGFSTLHSEVRLDSVPIQGAVPAWLTGTLLRTAPARFEVGDQAYNHWFDGLAMLHKFAFEKGRVAYANRYLRSRAYTEAMAGNRISRSEFATDPSRSLFGRVAAWFSPKITDNCNVSVNALANAIVALTETRLPIRFDPQTLNELGFYAHDERIRGVVSTAHPHFDAARGLHYSYLLDFGRRSRYRLFSIQQQTGHETIVASIEAERPAYVHSFGMTQRHLVFAEFPLVVNPLRLKFSGEPFIRNYRWEPDRGVRFHIIDKDTGRVVRTAQSRPLFAFHHVNAFEERDDIFVDIVIYPDAGIIDQLYLDRLRTSSDVTLAGKLTRFRISSSGKISEQPLFDAPVEFPRINYPRCAGRPYRFVFAAGNQVRGNFLDRLVKIDLERAGARSWREESCYPGEPVFVASPDARNEDDGVVLSVVLDARTATSFLLILDAASLNELGRALVPHPITFGFHGNYFASPSSFATHW